MEDEKEEGGAQEGAPSLPWATREEALAAIAGAEDWSQLFDRANQALGRDRRHWGDELAPSAAAALAWRTCAFPIAAAPRWRHQGAGGAESVDGALLVEASFELAKLVAMSLLGDFTPRAHEEQKERERRRREKGELVLLDTSPLARSLEQAKGAWMKTLWRLRQASALGEGASRGKLDEHLLGMHGCLVLDPSAMAFLLHRSKASETTWEEVAAASRSQPGDPRVADAMRSRCGLALLRAGPGGGMGEVEKALVAVDEASHQMGRAFGAPQSMLGAGGLALDVNYQSDEDYSACYIKGYHSMHVPRVKEGDLLLPLLAHEWTHALEALSKKSQDPRMMSSLSALFKAIKQCPQDPSAIPKAWRQGFSLSQLDGLGEDLESSLEDRAREPWSNDPAARAQEARLIEREWDEILRCLPTSQPAPKSAVIKAAASLARTRKPDAPGPNLEYIQDCLNAGLRRRQELAAVDKSLRAGECAFVAAARRQDLGRERHYWSKDGEMIARIAEAAVGRNEKMVENQDMAPQGRERDFLVAAYREFIQSVAPALLDDERLKPKAPTHQKLGQRR